MSTFGEDDLFEVVGEVLRPDPDVPADWEEAAFAAYTWRTVDEELLALTYDSLMADARGVRGGDERVLEFSNGGLNLAVELGDRRIVGRVTGEVRGELELVLEAVDGRVSSAAADGSGFFSLAGEERGLVRFCVRGGGSRLVTEWIAL